MTTDLELRYANSVDVPRLSALMGYAFQNDPVSRWLFPDDTDRTLRHPAFFSVFLHHAITAGSVLRTVDFRAVALWLDIDPAGTPPDTSRLQRELAEACGPNYPRFQLLQQLMAQRHPTPRPHAYLTFIAVAPRLWSKGLGTRLLRHKLTQLDLSNTPSYLEASSPRSRALYQRLGFTDLDQPINLPDGPKLYPMWRAAGGVLPAGRLDNTGTSDGCGSVVEVRCDVAGDEPTSASGGGWLSGSCVGGPDRWSPATMGWVNERRYTK
jgi:ribosomal protein S18 acetylase RimI-like enzyme